MTNPARGESSFKLNGETVTLRPTLDAMIRIEKAVGKSAFALVTQLGDPRSLNLTDVLSIIEIGLKAGPDANTLPKSSLLREQLYDLGMLPLIQICAAFLGGAVGATDSEEEGKEDTTKGNE